MTPWYLVSDVGGTNVRFARAAEDGSLTGLAEFEAAPFATFTDALDTWLARVGDVTDCAGAFIGAAGPVDGDRVKLTNSPWTIDTESVAHRIGSNRVRLFNDLQAVALSLPYLQPGDLVPLTARHAPGVANAARIAVNVGTGFGAATLIESPHGWISNGSEAGHMTLAAAGEDEFRLLGGLEPAPRSVEDVLSGPGLQHLYEHLRGTRDARAVIAPGRHVFDLVGEDPAAARASALFTALLARTCGDLVLATSAWGGVYLFGSVIHAWSQQADLQAFLTTFAAKGKMSERMAEVPLYLLDNPSAPLIGLAHQR